MATDVPLGPNVNEEPAPADSNELAGLREKLAKAEQQRDEMLRTVAEYDNARKRSARDLEVERKFASEKLAAALLPALDNLERAIDAATKAGAAPGLVQGVQATQTQLLDALKRFGVTRIDAQPGQAFDPNLHQAVSMVPASDLPANAVVQVLQTGFMIHDRVLRPAAVVVSQS
jgi:molecular chaperone GrpE